MQRLQDRVALVTGGGRGIGRSTALLLASEGASVAVAARSRAEVEAVAHEIDTAAAPGAPPGDAAALPLVCDVASRESAASAISAIESRWGRIDILVNAAGEAASAPLGRTGDDLWERMISVNLTGTF